MIKVDIHHMSTAALVALTSLLKTCRKKLLAEKVETLAEFDLVGSPRPDESGVFLGHSRVGTVGVAVNRWIGYHGFTLNVSTFLEPFDLISAGPNGAATREASIESWRQRPAPMAKVREAVIRQVEAVFGLERHHLYTQHPLIRQKVGPHAYAPSLG